MVRQSFQTVPKKEMKHIFINSIPRQGRGKCSTFENFFSRNPKQNVSIFLEYICSVSKQNIFLREWIFWRNYWRLHADHDWLIDGILIRYGASVISNCSDISSILRKYIEYAGLIRRHPIFSLFFKRYLRYYA